MRASRSYFPGPGVAHKYQVSLLYLIAIQSYKIITLRTWELVPHSKISNRGHSLKRAESLSFSGHHVASKYQVSLLYLIAKQSYRIITSGTWEVVPHSKIAIGAQLEEG